MTYQTYTAFIFARGGSKGLPGKNLKSLNGKPLLQRAIEACQATAQLERVIVSTDSADIAKLALSLGAEVPFSRPSNLAQDDSPELEAWRHALTTLSAIEGIMPETIVSVPTTAPLREPEDISKCLELYETSNADLVVASSPSPHNPYFNLFETANGGDVSIPMLKSENAFRRQNVPPVNFISPTCFVAKSSYVLSCKSIFEGKVRTHIVAPEHAVDIDTQIDFEFAEYLLTKREGAIASKIGDQSQ